MFKRITSFTSALVISLSSLFVLAPMVAHAVVTTCKWTGATNNNFSTTTNWDTTTPSADCHGTGVPASGDTLSFDNSTLSANVTLNNDMTGLSLADINVSGSLAYKFTLTGNSITLNGTINNASNNFFEIGIQVTAGADLTIAGLNGATFVSGGLLALGTHNLAVNSSFSAYSSDVSGSGTITVGSSHAYTAPTGTSAFTGNVVVNGTMSVGTAAGLVNVSGITINTGGRLILSLYYATGAVAFPTPITLNSMGVTGNYPQGALTVNFGPNTTGVSLSAVTLSSDSTYNSSGTADQKTTVTATLNGHSITRLDGSQGLLDVNGPAIDSSYKTVTFTSPADDYTGAAYDDTLGDKFKYLLNNKTTANYDVLKGGIIGGSGTIGTLKIENGAHVAPGNSPGCLSSGNLTFVAGSIYDFEVGGPTECTEYDQIKVTGTVTLGNGTLNTILYNGFKPVKGQSYKIIDNDAADAVSGTFLNLAEGATFTVGGYVLKISYVGGTGNDVVLTVQSVPAVPDTGFKLLLNNPVLTLVSTTLLAGAMIVIAKKYAHATTRK